jgi:hypothetical protein
MNGLVHRDPGRRDVVNAMPRFGFRRLHRIPSIRAPVFSAHHPRDRSIWRSEYLHRRKVSSELGVDRHRNGSNRAHSARHRLPGRWQDPSSNLDPPLYDLGCAAQPVRDGACLNFRIATRTIHSHRRFGPGDSPGHSQCGGLLRTQRLVRPCSRGRGVQTIPTQVELSMTHGSGVPAVQTPVESRTTHGPDDPLNRLRFLCRMRCGPDDPRPHLVMTGYPLIDFCRRDFYRRGFAHPAGIPHDAALLAAAALIADPALTFQALLVSVPV